MGVRMASFRRNISNPRTGLDFKSAQFDQVRGEAEDVLHGSKCEDLKSSPVRIGAFQMISHANKSLFN
jgi:hypothetical protein